MGDYLTIQKAVAKASKAADCVLTQVPGKKIVFRLEGNGLFMWDWRMVKHSLTENCMKYNKRNGYHRTLCIYDDQIKILGNPKEIRLVSRIYIDYI